jgi:hypothetical protein
MTRTGSPRQNTIAPHPRARAAYQHQSLDSPMSQPQCLRIQPRCLRIPLRYLQNSSLTFPRYHYSFRRIQRSYRSRNRRCHRIHTTEGQTAPRPRRQTVGREKTTQRLWMGATSKSCYSSKRTRGSRRLRSHEQVSCQGRELSRSPTLLTIGRLREDWREITGQVRYQALTWVQSIVDGAASLSATRSEMPPRSAHIARIGAACVGMFVGVDVPLRDVPDPQRGARKPNNATTSARRCDDTHQPGFEPTPEVQTNFTPGSGRVLRGRPRLLDGQ